MYKRKADVLKDCPEIGLAEHGDFYIKNEFIEDYEIIDFHSHLFSGLKECFPKALRKEICDFNASFFDESYVPFSLKLFDLNKITYTTYPETLYSVDGLRAKCKFAFGGFVIRKSTPDRMIRDMKLNGINKSLVLQINPPNKSVAMEMDEIIKNHSELMTFGSIHPNDSNIKFRMDEYLSMDIKGWKMAPHIGGYNIDSPNSIKLIKMLVDTNMPILSCCGTGVPQQFINSNILSRKQKKEIQTQNVRNFFDLQKFLHKSPLILGHAGIFEIEDLIELMKNFPNVYTDISTQPHENIRLLINKIGSQRLLFGSDYPFWNHAFPIISVLRATKSDIQRRQIFSENARRLLNL